MVFIGSSAEDTSGGTAGGTASGSGTPNAGGNKVGASGSAEVVRPMQEQVAGPSHAAATDANGLMACLGHFMQEVEQLKNDNFQLHQHLAQLCLVSLTFKRITLHCWLDVSAWKAYWTG